MTSSIGQELATSIHYLKQASIQTARLDSLIVFEDILKKDRTWIIAHPEAEISKEEKLNIKNVLKIRAKHVPLAYIRGKSSFYGREFVINNNVLQPRPESETFIDEMKSLLELTDIKSKLPHRPRLLDVGTGSGVLGITLALELPILDIQLVDIDESALKVAKINVDFFTLNISTVVSDLLSNTTPDFDILICNLPYVPDGYPINTAATYEPPIALYSGKDGLDANRKLFEQVRNQPYKPLLILTEIFPEQHANLDIIAHNCGYTLLRSNDFIQTYKLI